MTSAARKSASVFLLFVLLAGLAWWLTGPAPRQGGQPYANPPPSPPQPGSVDSPEIEDAGSLPLPFEGLRLRAEAGDSRAACQLGAKLIYCASVQRYIDEDMQARMARSERMLAEQGQPEQANQYAQAQIKAVAARRECAGLPDQAGRMGHAWMRHAALAGEPDAMLLHASGRTLVTSFDDGWSFLQDERFKQWRADSPVMLQSLLEQGDPAALIALLQGYDNQQYLGWITQPDPDRALTLSLLANHVFKQPGGLSSGGYSVDLRESVARERYREAMVRARDWHEQYFGAQKFELEPYRERLEVPTGMGDWDFDPPRICGARWGEQ